MDEVQEKIIRVSNSLGIHARPAGKISQEAQRYQAQVILKANEMEADAKSILDILALAAPQGTELVIRTQGPDAAQAMQGVIKIFDDLFGE
ncbi:MAG: HPr family phosphocarrier protein [Desulfomicrobium sp.]|jgi:phosphocarrier protein|nr:HPr family phosphocarrier protein [Desulfomicrobium sp.]NLV96041.1 HPr family phosphocarrier protein [Desulfovibrionales bacterium]